VRTFHKAQQHRQRSRPRGDHVHWDLRALRRRNPPLVLAEVGAGTDDADAISNEARKGTEWLPPSSSTARYIETSLSIGKTLKSAISRGRKGVSRSLLL